MTSKEKDEAELKLWKPAPYFWQHKPIGHGPDNFEFEVNAYCHWVPCRELRFE